MIEKLENLNEHFKQYDADWLRKFLIKCFGKNGYTHSASETGLDTYLSNLREVSQSSPADLGCVVFRLFYDNGRYEIFNLVDFKDKDEFLRLFNKYIKLKAFI